jgi:hypothetical protein
MLRPVLLAALLLAPVPVQAVEYRLQVAHLKELAFASYFEGRIGQGVGELAMTRLQRALEGGTIPRGALLYDRGAEPVTEAAAGFRAIPAVATPGATAPARPWQEIVWDGVPGQRTVWVVAPMRTKDQQVAHIALKGSGPALRYHIPYTVGFRPTALAAVSYPQVFVRMYAERGTLWDRYLGRHLAPAEGIAAVVGVNDNPTFADWVYIVIDHAPGPTAYAAVVGWDRRRGADRSNLEGVGREQ